MILINETYKSHTPFIYTICHLTPRCVLHPIGHGDADVRHLGCHEGLAEVQRLLWDQCVLIGSLLGSVPTGGVSQLGQGGQSQGLQVRGGGDGGGGGQRQKLGRVAWITVD